MNCGPTRVVQVMQMRGCVHVLVGWGGAGCSGNISRPSVPKSFIIIIISKVHIK